MNDLSKIQIEPDPVIEVYKRDVDVIFILENLRLTVEERFVELMRLQEFAEELPRAMWQMDPLFTPTVKSPAAF